ncbi:Glycoside hydrolase, family 28 [Heracleum sosnowskyi]|uniref:Glycoside hydrolase, family 28 n=1 Tax=Heracleum sosnowskyi TaxID=360622 RepID=A0AAD8IDF2_9APIA|nr:Glycoside hydrolase, family 28 [Heracleum sosnowskyi]
MRGFNRGGSKFLVFIALLVVLSIEHRVSSARQGKQFVRQQNTNTPTSPLLKDKGAEFPGQRIPRLMREVYQAKTVLSAGSDNTIFNVLDYGAKGDGATDDTKAFEAAWVDTCKVEASTMMIPSGSVFLVKPISFSGPNCEPNIVFQLDGKIIAPTNAQAWGSGLLQWLEFTKLQGITVRGKGIIDGQGSVWWTKKLPTNDPNEDIKLTSNSTKLVSNNTSLADLVSVEAKGKLPHTKPTALRFYGSTGVTVTGITIQNSQQTHLKFDDCTVVQVFGISVASPGDSPNTDGIHLQNSQNVLIHNSNLACGDDCISIQTGCSGIFIHDVICGPGHGISIGSLGKDNSRACVSNITVRDIKMHDTENGVRIKTWQGGSGSVQGVMFANIQVSEVQHPIIIDQFYCDGEKCNNHTSAVGISAITFQNITGTYTKSPVHFACSDTMPCTGVTLNSIELTATQEIEPFCWQTFGKLQTETIPPVNCLKAGNKPNYNRC